MKKYKHDLITYMTVLNPDDIGKRAWKHFVTTPYNNNTIWSNYIKFNDIKNNKLEIVRDIKSLDDVYYFNQVAIFYKPNSKCSYTLYLMSLVWDFIGRISKHDPQQYNLLVSKNNENIFELFKIQDIELGVECEIQTYHVDNSSGYFFAHSTVKITLQTVFNNADDYMMFKLKYM